LMNSIDLLIDNATEGSGYTPIITPILGKYLIIKLGIKDNYEASQIFFESSHEFMHYVFYAIQGLDKEFADAEEEAICTAASLIIIKEFYPKELVYWCGHVNSKDEKYRKGVDIAKSVEFDFKKLKELVYAKTGYQE